MAQGGDDVRVTHAFNANDRTADDVQIGDIRRWRQEVTQMRGGENARHKRDESYEVDINIYVVRQDPEDADNQAWEIWEVVDAILSADPSLGVTNGINTLVVGRTREGFINRTADEAQRGWRSRILMRVSVTNKI